MLMKLGLNQSLPSKVFLMLEDKLPRKTETSVACVEKPVGWRSGELLIQHQVWLDYVFFWLLEMVDIQGLKYLHQCHCWDQADFQIFAHY